MASLPGRKSLLLLSDNVPLDRQENGLSPESPPLLPPSSGGAAVLVTVPKIDTGGTTNRGSGEASDVRTSYEIQVQHIAELAIRSSVVIYTVDTRGIAVTFPTAADTFKGMAGEIARQIGPTMSARSRMLYDDLAGAEVMAKETGGFMISNSNDFGLKDVYEDSQGYYLIGFRPREETFDEKFHHISVKVKRDGFTVRTRKGFYGVTDDVAHAAMQKSPNTITEALRSPFGASQMTVRLNSLFTDTNDAGPLLRISIYVNARDLSFTESADGAHEAGFEVGSILFGDNGEVIYLRNQTATLHLNASQYERTLREGVLYGFDVPLKYFGAGQFRIAVRDRASGHLGTAGQVVILPDLRRKSLAMSGIILSTDKINKAATIDDLGNVPAVRRFRQGDKLLFAYAVYKARLKNGKPQLTTQTRLFHDRKLFFTGNATALSTFGQNDFARIIGGSRLQLGKEFPTGDYVLQIVITDNLGKEKEQMTTQWIDFEVVK